MEADLKSWINLSSRTEDPVGLSTVRKRLEDKFKKLGFRSVPAFTNGRSAWTWETKGGFDDGTLLVVPIDVPGERTGFPIPFRTEEEWIFGEGVGSSRGGIVTIISALQALKELKLLANTNVGVFFYSDEGRGMRYSNAIFKEAAKVASEVIVLQPGFLGGKIAEQRRGSKQFNVIVEGDPIRVGKSPKTVDVLSYFIQKAEKLQALTNRGKKLAVAVQDVRSERYSVLMPHRVHATVSITYLEEGIAMEAESELKDIFQTKTQGNRTFIEKITERPPLVRRKNNDLLTKLKTISDEWHIPYGVESSLLASAAGEVPEDIPVICGFSPASKDLYTPNEAIHRSELVQRAILLALLLHENANEN